MDYKLPIIYIIYDEDEEDMRGCNVILLLAELQRMS